MAGYGCESSGYSNINADIALRKCLSSPDPLIPGPRYFCANRAIVSTGSYGPKSSIYVNQEGIDGAEVADGVDECTKAVRRQIGAGAYWIKIYADYRFRSRLVAVSTAAGGASMQTFNKCELTTLINTAHEYGVKIAAHATNRETVRTLVQSGIDSVEHGYDISPDGQILDFGHAIWVPTLAASYTLGQGHDGFWERSKRSFQSFLANGNENIACGGDTGVFTHGENALEMKLMVRLGADWRKVLKWGTLGGWECIRSMRWEGVEGRDRLES